MAKLQYMTKDKSYMHFFIFDFHTVLYSELKLHLSDSCWSLIQTFIMQTFEVKVQL